MQWRFFVMTVVVVGLIAIFGVASPRLLGAKSLPAPATQPLGADISGSVTPALMAGPATPPASMTPATSGLPTGTPTPAPRATLPPVFTPTPPVRVGVAANPASANPAPVNPAGPSTGGGAHPPGGPPAPIQQIAASAPPARPSATPTSTRTATPLPTATPTATATATPAYDFIVANITEIPHAEYRDTAYIRGRLIDQQGHLVSGAYFQIRNDAYPDPYVAVEPHGNIAADGTVTFVVTRGRFAVSVLGGRSQDAGWMVTGTGAGGPLSDFAFTFQETRPISAGTLVAPTPTDTAVIPTATSTAVVPTRTPTAPTPSPTSAVGSPTPKSTPPTSTGGASTPPTATVPPTATSIPPTATVAAAVPTASKAVAIPTRPAPLSASSPPLAVPAPQASPTP